MPRRGPTGGTRTTSGDRIHGLRNPQSRRVRAAQVARSTRPLLLAGAGDIGGLRRGDGRKKKGRYRRPKRPVPTNALSLPLRRNARRTPGLITARRMVRRRAGYRR